MNELFNYLDNQSNANALLFFFIALICFVVAMLASAMNKHIKIGKKLAELQRNDTLHFDSVPPIEQIEPTYRDIYDSNWQYRKNCKIIIKLVSNDTN